MEPTPNLKDDCSRRRPVRASVAGDDAQSQGYYKRISFHLKTLWLFTRSDLKSMIYPNVVFGVVSALSGTAITTNGEPDLISIVSNVPWVVIWLWLWLNLLLFNISNQRLSSSIVEDQINKPWRPLPSGRLGTVEARALLLLVIPTVLASSLYLGAMTEVLLLMSLTWMYNDLGGGDEDFLVRNLINAFGMSFYGSGAIVVACGSNCELTSTGYRWIALVGVIILTTLQVQDMSDQRGDAMRGRRTMPLVFGDGVARWSIGVPAFWQADVTAYVGPIMIGGTLALRVLVLRNVEADQGTWRLWCVWMISLYLLPL